MAFYCELFPFILTFISPSPPNSIDKFNAVSSFLGPPCIIGPAGPLIAINLLVF
jgi:hypothetical protein